MKTKRLQFGLRELKRINDVSLLSFSLVSTRRKSAAIQKRCVCLRSPARSWRGSSGKAACVFTSGAWRLPLRPSGFAIAAPHGARRRHQNPPDESLEKECEVSALLSVSPHVFRSCESSELASGSHDPAGRDSWTFAYLRRCSD